MKNRRTVFHGLLDQGVVSLTSLLILASAAQSLGPNKLGLFSIGMASIVSAVAIIRAMTGETFLVRITSQLAQGNSQSRGGGQAPYTIGLAILLGLGASAAILFIGLLWQEPRPVLFCAALSVVPIVAQDCMRHISIAYRRTTSLLGADLLVLVLSISGIYFSGRVGLGPEFMILAWGTAGATGASLIMVSDNVRPSFRGAFTWLKTVWPSSSAFVVEAALGALVGYSIVVVLGTVSSPAEVAGYRATISVFGITSLVINFLRTAVLRELSPKRLSMKPDIWKTALILSAMVSSVSVMAFAVIILMPAGWGYAAFGDTWSLVTQLSPWATLNRIGAGLSIIPLIFLRVQGVSWSATKIRLILTIPLLVFAPFASALFGAPGALLVEAGYYLCITVLLMRLALLGIARGNK